MAKIIIKLASTEVRRDINLFEKQADLICAAALKAGKFEIFPAFDVIQKGEDGAEEAFDLTNNPSRQEERELKFGRHRSVCVGDVVEVDGVNFLCDTFGWCEI
jgi:hypothetical protein